MLKMHAMSSAGPWALLLAFCLAASLAGALPVRGSRHSLRGETMERLDLFANDVILRAAFLNASQIHTKSHSQDDTDGGVSVDLPTSVSCTACKLLVGTVQDLIQSNASEDVIVKVAIDICIGLKEADDRVCHGIIPEFKDEFIGVLADVALDPKEFCGYLLGNSCAIPHNPYDESWTVPLLNTSKPVYVPPVVPAGKPMTVFAHLSDIHYDGKYAAGSLAKCTEPLCCRAWFGPGDAGSYGSFNCDSPMLLLESTLQELAKITPPLKYLIFTGDVPAHNIWNQSRNDIIQVIAEVSNMFAKYLPNTKVYPALGNHESAPVNSFPPPFVTGYNSHKWLLDTLATYWGKDLPASTLETIRLGGYYSVEVEPGFQIISLNINYCNPQNYWLLINDTDPTGQLAWFRDQLQEAETKNAKVYILGHIPPRGGCLKAWSWAYHKIASRYANTIRAQFFGHYHSDQEAIFYDEEKPTMATGVWYIGPSVTPYAGGGGLYPAYRLYEKDGDYAASTHSILDHSTYILNLTAIAVTKEPVWKLEYSAKAAYGMDSLNPSEWDKLATRMLTDDSLVQKYHAYVTHSALVKPCDAGCRTGLLCALKTTRADDNSHCDDLLDTDEDLAHVNKWHADSLSNC